MLGLSYSSSRSAPLYGFLLLLLALVLTHLLPAQTRSTRKAIRHTELNEAHSFSPQTVPDPPVLASFSRRQLAPLSETRPSESLSATAAPTASLHQSVNLNLPLAPSTERERTEKEKWSTSVPSNASSRNLIFPSNFAEPSDRSTDDAANRLAERLNDPEFYAHHIPGAGPIVDRVLKESKAHPHLTRVLEFIQPQF
jgi:hypothetical protein